MTHKLKNRYRGREVLSGILALSITFPAIAAYVPFPGKHHVRLIRIDAANSVVVNFETWPGFARTLRVTLPNLDIPGDSTQPKSCELELAQKALAFTENFITSAKEITVHDMLMETSADEDAIAPVYTEKGSLATELKNAGLARSSSISPDTPWCNQGGI